MAIPLGMCQCGCGDRTAICKHTSKKFGVKKGVPNKYISGHQPKSPKFLSKYKWRCLTDLETSMKSDRSGWSEILEVNCD